MLSGASFSGFETGVLAVYTSAVNAGMVLTALEIGVGIGSVAGGAADTYGPFY